MCQSFHALTREIVKEVVSELRRGYAQRTDYAADDESEGDVPRRKLRKQKSRYPGVRRRPAEQNALSVGFLIPPFPSLTLLLQRQIRAHMRTLIHQDNWLKDVMNEHDLEDWDPTLRECCTADQFKLQLRGTPCCPWNASAARVFTDHFLQTHTEIYPDVWAVRRMVLRKTQACIKSLIRAFRQNGRSGDIKLALRRAKNRRERKTSVSPSK